eukprot:3159990-Rhodomonas_salina.1
METRRRWGRLTTSPRLIVATNSRIAYFTYPASSVDQSRLLQPACAQRARRVSYGNICAWAISPSSPYASPFL